jgi:hypothetical protein
LAGYPECGLTGYPAGQYGIRPDTGYGIKKAGYPSGRISVRPDIRCIPNKKWQMGESLFFCLLLSARFIRHKKGAEDLLLIKGSSVFFVQWTRHSIFIKFISRSRIYLSTAGWHTSHNSILISGAECPYYDSPVHITMVSIAAKIHTGNPSMQFPHWNKRVLCHWVSRHCKTWDWL